MTHWINLIKWIRFIILNWLELNGWIRSTMREIKSSLTWLERKMKSQVWLDFMPPHWWVGIKWTMMRCHIIMFSTCVCHLMEVTNLLMATLNAKMGVTLGKVASHLLLWMWIHFLIHVHSLHLLPLAIFALPLLSLDESHKVLAHLVLVIST